MVRNVPQGHDLRVHRLPGDSILMSVSQNPSTGIYYMTVEDLTRFRSFVDQPGLCPRGSTCKSATGASDGFRKTSSWNLAEPLTTGANGTADGNAGAGAPQGDRRELIERICGETPFGSRDSEYHTLPEPVKGTVSVKLTFGRPAAIRCDVGSSACVRRVIYLPDLVDAGRTAEAPVREMPAEMATVRANGLHVHDSGRVAVPRGWYCRGRIRVCCCSVMVAKRRVV